MTEPAQTELVFSHPREAWHVLKDELRRLGNDIEDVKPERVRLALARRVETMRVVILTRRRIDDAEREREAKAAKRRSGRKSG